MSRQPHEVPVLSRLVGELHKAPLRHTRDLYCPFPSAVHPDVDAVQARSVEWAQRTGLCAGDRAERRLRGAKIGWLAARAYPSGDAAIVQIAADWTTLFCLLDDHVERLSGPAAVSACLDELGALLAGGGDPGQDPMKRACVDLHTRLSAVATTGWMDRFQGRVRQLFDTFTWEAAVRRAGEIPRLDAYLPMREVTVGLYVEFEIGELACGAELGPRARRHPAVVALARMASNIVGWCNDVWTCEKEIGRGEGTNLVAVLAQAEALSLQDALARAIARHDEEVRSFVALSSDLPSLGKDEDAALRRHAAMWRSWVRGHLDWGRETGRYDPRAAEPARSALAG